MKFTGNVSTKTKKFLNSANKLRENLDIIGWTFGNLQETISSGLPGAPDEEWGYDEELVNDIAEACQRWKKRKGNDD